MLHTSVSTGVCVGRNASQETLKGTNQPFDFKVTKSTTNITGCVENRSKEAEDERRREGIALNVGCDRKMIRRQN